MKRLTLKEITKLRLDEKNNVLREPNNLLSKNFDNESIRKLIILISRLILMSNNSIVFKTAIKSNPLVVKFHGRGDLEKPYYIETLFGKGKLFDARASFENNQCPEVIQANRCFSNSMTLALSMANANMDAKIISGIQYDYNNKKSILHSVVAVDDIIIDFNYNIGMTKDLYMKLFSFEPISVLSGDTLLRNVNIINDEINNKNLKLYDWQMLFAYDDFCEFVYDDKRIQNELTDYEIDDIL